MRLKLIYVGSFDPLFFDCVPSSFVGDNSLLFCYFPSLVRSSSSLFISCENNIATTTFLGLPTWQFSSLSTTDCFWSTCSLRICTSHLNYISVSSLVILLNNVICSLSLPILETGNLYQKLWKSQKWNPQQNFQYHSGKLSCI